MEALCAISACLILLVTLIWSWKMLTWLWLRPKKLEKLLREQGLKGNPYKLLVGDMKEFFKMQLEARSKPMPLSDDIVPRVFPLGYQTIAKHGILLYASKYLLQLSYIFFCTIIFIYFFFLCILYGMNISKNDSEN
jgi:hypothetical protein